MFELLHIQTEMALQLGNKFWWNVTQLQLLDFVKLGEEYWSVGPSRIQFCSPQREKCVPIWIFFFFKKRALTIRPTEDPESKIAIMKTPLCQYNSTKEKRVHQEKNSKQLPGNWVGGQLHAFYTWAKWV